MVGYAYYGDGTATATTGSNIVIGQNTGWLSQIGTLTPIKAGDKFGIHVGNPIIIASIDSDTQITLEDVWPGPDQTEAPYKIELTNPSVIAIEAVRQLLASLSNGVLASLSTVPLDVDKIPIGIGPGVFGLIDKLALTQGVAYDVMVDTLAGRDAYDGQSEGYSVLVADNGDGRAALYVKNSNTSGDWSDPAYITGPVGPEGVQQRGNYSAVTAYEVDDLVQYGGSTWIAKVATTGNAPPTLPTVENAQWLLFARSGTAGIVDRGAYSAATAYAENDIVLDNGSTWIAIAPTTGNAPPTLPTESNAYWRLLARKGTDGAGTGDVVGPTGGTTANQVVGFADVTGKLIKGLTPAEVRAFASVPISNFRNKIMNGLGAINTRAVTGTVTLAAGAFGHDRMKAGASGCTYTFATSNGVTTFTITAGSLQQTIEARSFAGQNGRYWLSWVGTAQGRIDSGSYGTSGLVFADIDASANVTVEFNTGTLSLPQLEIDYVSSFSSRPQNVEEMLCRRFLPGVNSGVAGALPTFGFATTASNAVFTVPFIVRSRVIPTGVTVFGTGSFTTFAAAQTVTSWSYQTTTSDVAGEILITTSGAGFTASHAGWLRAATASTLNIYFTGADL